MFGQKELTQKNYKDFERKYKELKTSLGPNKESKLFEMYDEMEKGLTYLGCSAIEDKL